MLSRIGILLLKRSFGRKEIILQERNLKHKKIMQLIKFILSQLFFYRFIPNFKNDVILINHGPLFQEKDSLQHNHFQFSKMYKLFQNSVIYL